MSFLQTCAENVSVNATENVNVIAFNLTVSSQAV